MEKWKERESDRYSHDKWYENIWYHHKFHIILGAILLAFIIVIFYSTRMNDPTDMYIFLVTDSPDVYTERTTTLTKALTPYAEDKNGDGKVVLFIENLYIGEEFDAANTYKNKEKIMTALRSGNSMFIIADSSGAEYLTSADVCADLTKILPEKYAQDIVMDGQLWDWAYSDFKVKNNNVLYDIFGDMHLYFGIRQFEGTIAELTASASKNYEMAKNLLIALASNTKAE